MLEYLECDRCGAKYTDEASIVSAKKGAEGYRAMCEADGDVARGLAPCPNISCRGELILKGNDLRTEKQIEDLRAMREASRIL